MATKTFRPPQRGGGRRELSKKYDMPPFLTTENIQLPLDNGGLSDGDKKISVAIRHAPTIGCQLK
jgi:hypothetical protein